MKVKFNDAPIGSKFAGIPSGTVFMKIEAIKIENLFDSKLVFWKRNVVTIEGNNKGELLTFLTYLNKYL